MGSSLLAKFASIAASVAIAFAAFTLQADARTNYALIVGVTEYPNLPKKTWLVGPNNDAELVREYLTDHAGFDPGNITVLADDLDGATSPTLANIRGAMKALAAKIEADGDDEPFVYLHFSGHGSQMPARGEDSENDGKDEVFLPADTMKWDRAQKGFPNAYVDDAIGEDLDRLRNSGAFVWAVFDACHSSSATRAAPGEGVEVSRRLDPAELGVPEDVIFTATRSVSGQVERENPIEGSRDSIAKGGLVAFFAAQTVETTPEMPLPRDAEEQRRYGLFTYTLFENLTKYPGISYRQLGQTVLQAYSGMNRRAPTPLFEGELDSGVFGVENQDPVLQWKIKPNGKRATIAAGLMHRLSKGTKMALLKNAADDVDAAIGYAEVKSAKNLKSTLVPIAHNDLAAPDEATLAEAAWARPIELAIGFELTVARTAPGGHSETINAALDKLAADEKQLFRIRLVDHGAPADISMSVASEMDIIAGLKGDALNAHNAVSERSSTEYSANPRVWFLPSSGEASLLPGRRPPSMAFDASSNDGDDLKNKLAGRMTKIFRATNLARMTAASDFRGKVDMNFLIKRSDADDFTPIEAGEVPYVTQDDEIHIRVANKSSRAIDLNVLHIGTDYAISAADPIRIERRGKEEIGLFAVETDTLGVERLVAVITEALPGTDVQDLRFLSQGGVRAVEATKGVGGDDGFVSMLNAMGKQAKTRAASSLSAKKGAKGAVLIFPIETVEEN